MLELRGWPFKDIQSIEEETLVVIGDADIVRPEHAVEMARLLRHAQLAVLPGADHMALVTDAHLQVPMIEAFPDAPLTH